MPLHVGGRLPARLPGVSAGRAGRLSMLGRPDGDVRRRRGRCRARSRAAEEDVKEEWLLYSVLAQAKANRTDIPAIDAAIEAHLAKEFGVTVDFDVEDALERLLNDGIVSEGADGTLTTLGPKDAAHHIDVMWDSLLDHLPDPGRSEGTDFA